MPVQSTKVMQYTFISKQIPQKMPLSSLWRASRHQIRYSKTYSSQSSFWQQAMLFVTPDTTLLLQGLWFGVAVRDTFYPWRGKLHIQVFSLCIGLASDGQYHKDVSRHLRVGWNMVKDIHKKYLKSRYSRPDIRNVRRIGIDEFATNKGHVYKTIVVDLDTGRIIHVGEGKGKAALEEFWKRVRRNKAKIEIVTSDLSAAFIASVMENAPDAVHVYDKFHVVKLVNEAVDTVRRYVYAQETDLEKRKIIKGSRWLLLTKDKDVFDEYKKRRLDNILQTNTPLFHAYYLKEDLDQIWMQKAKKKERNSSAIGARGQGKQN